MKNNYYYSFWPGTYSFKDEIALFILALRDKLDEVLQKIEESETTIEEQLLIQDMKNFM